MLLFDNTVEIVSCVPYEIAQLFPDFLLFSDFLCYYLFSITAVDVTDFSNDQMNDDSFVTIKITVTCQCESLDQGCPPV